MAILNTILGFFTQSFVNMTLLWIIIVIICVLITSGIKFIMKKTIKEFEAKKWEYLFAGISTISSFALLFGFNWVHSGYGVVTIIVTSFTHSLMAIGCYKFFCQPPRIIFNKIKKLGKDVISKVKKGKVPVQEIVDGIKDLMNDNGSAIENASTIDVVEAYKQKKAELEQKK